MEYLPRYKCRVAICKFIIYSHCLLVCYFRERRNDGGNIRDAQPGKSPQYGPGTCLGSGVSDQPLTWPSFACGPLSPCTTSNSTRSPSLRDLKPEPMIALKWTKTSLSPSSRVMKP